MSTAVLVEVGKRRAFASALEWPGWSRSAKTPDHAMEQLAAYAPRYRRITDRAGVRFPASTATFTIAETLPGDATTDFGAPSAICGADREAMTAAYAKKCAVLLDAAWSYFDEVASTSAASLTKGPRGGGRELDAIVEHVVAVDAVYARKLGISRPAPTADDHAAVHALRAEVAAALRSARSVEPASTTKTWPYRYAARRLAWHILDHAWEIEDRQP